MIFPDNVMQDFPLRDFNTFHMDVSAKVCMTVSGIDDLERVFRHEVLMHMPRLVIGGGSVYRQMLPWCDTAYVTRVYRSYEADTFFPDLDASEQWELCEAGEKREHEGLCYAFTCYRRKKA